MADLLVRGVDEDLVRALKERAGRPWTQRGGASTGQSWLPRSPARAGAALPRFWRRCRSAGADADFERVQSAGDVPHVFD